MARLTRSLLSDGFFHVTTRGAGRRRIYLDDEDYVLFLVLLLAAQRRVRWSCHALCLMGNHYHLVVETTVVRLSKAMHFVNGRYADEFNRKYGRPGHLFGDRFSAWAIEDEAHLANACRYVVNNPVRAGLCDRAADWPWSGSRYGVDV